MFHMAKGSIQMPHMIKEPIGSDPLEGNLIRERISARYKHSIATADVRANWGRIELRIIEPAHLAGIVWRRDRCGFITAMQAGADPSQRFTYRGALTARALRSAQQFIVQVLEDHEHVAWNANVIAERCIDAHERFKRIKSWQHEPADPSVAASLKQSFKQGLLSQRAYQQVRRRLREAEATRRIDHDLARRHVLANVSRGLTPHPIRFEHGLIHFAAPEIQATLDESLRQQIAQFRLADEGKSS